MNEDRVVGAARNFGGKAQEGIGRMTGDHGKEAEGIVNQATGLAQEYYGQAKDAAADAAQLVKQGAVDAEDYVRHFIEKRPYTTAIAAFCVGWAVAHLGRRD